ncbi:DotU family type IV/VI secretion system protein [Ralstonia sp. UBA689]|uniref:DotU family type IV/VI secretion system protein n=1 Tax=Ralstonia sp. UBA689 TaxID=1947373 RepID=UPI0025F648C6|nr:DotU family type IV/VI secretion system protein [Ralstonia sp. UBA689]
MRSLLRDTALLATTLAANGTTQDVLALRRRCVELMDRFAEALHSRGYPEDVCQDALIAQCGLLDELALRRLSGDHHANWEASPLQVERFNMHDAGERVFARLEQRMREAPPCVDLLECYSAVLGLDFVGRYAREGEAKRTALMSALNGQLQRLRGTPERSFIVDRGVRRLSDWFVRLSPWAIVGLAGGVALLVWLAWTAALDVQLAHLMTTKGIRP